MMIRSLKLSFVLVLGLFQSPILASEVFRPVEAMTKAEYVAGKGYTDPQGWLRVYYSSLDKYGRWTGQKTIKDSFLDEIFDLVRADFKNDYLEYIRWTTGKTFRSTRLATTPSELQVCDLELVKSGSAKLEYLFQLLKKNNKLQLLDPATRTELGGQWTQAEVSPHPKIPGYRIFGGYECSSQNIFLEQNLRPVNTSSLVAHEFSHLVHDQFWSPAAIPVRSLVFLDELVSYVTGALIQLNFKYNSRSVSLNQKIEDKLSWTNISGFKYNFGGKSDHSNVSFQPKSDLTMFNRNGNGNLDSLFQRNNFSVCGTMKYILDALGSEAVQDSDILGLTQVISIGNFGRDESLKHLQYLKNNVSWSKTKTLLSWLSQPVSADEFELQATTLIKPQEKLSPYCQISRDELTELEGYIGILNGGAGVKVEGGSGVKVERNSIRACQGLKF